MAGQDAVANTPGGCPRGAVEDVEQLAEGDGGRPDGAGALVGAGGGADEAPLGCGDRVETELAVLGTGVALSEPRAAGEDVVTVGPGGAREDAVVEAEQADHAVRDRAHRDHRAHSEGAGAEVGPG